MSFFIDLINMLIFMKYKKINFFSITVMPLRNGNLIYSKKYNHHPYFFSLYVISHFRFSKKKNTIREKVLYFSQEKKNKKIRNPIDSLN